MKQQVDMRYGIVRSEAEIETNSYVIDGKLCPKCRKLTVKGNDKTRRYCTNNSCNALIID